jgi:predicted aconitase with swiveling domain
LLKLGDREMRQGIRVLVGGNGAGTPVILGRPISPLGDLDQDRGMLRGEGLELRDKILMFPYAIGSSVGSYVLYSLAAKGLSPSAIFVEKADLMLVSGCALGGIPLIELRDEYGNMRDRLSVCRRASFSARVPDLLEITCGGTP